MAQQRQAWTVWIDRPYSLGRGQRGGAPVEEAIEQVYGLQVTYEGWMWNYHKVTIGKTSRSLAEAIAKTLLVMHLQHIREDIRHPWNGVCRFELTCSDEKPAWVQTYDRAREERLRQDAGANGGGQ